MIRFPRGLRARTAVGAGLVVLAVSTFGAFWMTHEVRSGQDQATRTLAEQQADTLINLSYQGVSFNGDYGSLPYELIAGDGQLLASSAVLKPYEQGGRPVMPAPGHGPATTLHASYRHTFAVDPAGGALSGQDLTAVDSTSTVIAGVPLTDPVSSEGYAVGTRIRAYVFVTETAGDRAVAGIAPFLGVAVPVVTALVMVVTVGAVRVSLRSVESIRARTAAVTASDPRERVEVPATGDEIEALAVTINHTLGRIEENVARQRAFVSDAAHELRGPLAALRVDLGVAREHPDHADRAHAGPRMERSVDRLTSLVDDMLVLARPGAGAHGPTGMVQLDSLVEEVVDDVRSIALARDVTLQERLEPGVVTGHGHVLARAIRNVVSNAVRHATSTVVVSLRVGRDAVVLDVADDGPGIDPADRERVFERFVRLDEARSRDAGGAGLGLAIAREGVAQYGGTVEVVEATLPGATFRIRLPRPT